MRKETNKLPITIFAIILSILLGIPSALAVFYYTRPMEDASYDLSLLPKDGQEWEGNKGWTVYTNEAGNITELTPDGAGGYLGVDHPGQTFYYSRTLTEELDSPTLQIGSVNQTFSIFIGDTLIYTDFPELENRIGYLELTNLEWDRLETISVSLPLDYLGQTLTIAQSSPVYSEVQKDVVTVWPCSVRLYCGYAYESGLIASASQTMLPVAFLFALELLLLAAFIRNATAGSISLQLPVFALAILFQICSILSKADFTARYIGTPSVDLVGICFHLSVGILLLFLAVQTKHLRPLYLACTAIQWCATLTFLLTQLGKLVPYGDLYVFFLFLPRYTGCFALLATLIGSFLLWKKGDRFFRHLSQAVLILAGCYVLFLLISIPFYPEYVSTVFRRLQGDTITHIPNASLKLIWNLCLISGLAAIVLELFEQEAERRTELAVLSARNELALESYENLRQQSQEVMMIRHDTMKHYSLLRQMAKDTPERIKDYLDELIGQVEAVRPVISTENQTLNILLNGKLHTAAEKGIPTEIVRADAPGQLPLSDSELCCLVANILDNAITAASAPGISKPYIRLDLHCKDRFFVFACENSRSVSENDKKNLPTPKHGYGIKIIRQIMSRFGEHTLSIDESETTYQVTVILPL
ncbi:MAG: GHKL domain-containing protein [bacterium]|nr:GHKL domain-containing protein [bacterium]